MIPEHVIQLNVLATQRNTAMDNLVVITTKLAQAEEEIKTLKAELAKLKPAEEAKKE